MKKTIILAALAISSSALGQTYDSSTLVDTNSTSNSTVTSTNTNNNTNVNTNTSTSTSTSTNTNNNNNTSTGTNTNYNVNSGTQTFNNNNNNTGDMTNRNINTTTSTNNNVNTGDMTNRNINDTTMTVRQPPPTAIAPAMMSGGNNDLCTTGTSGAVQTQILGVSSGGTVRDLNCERLKLSKTLYDMGMKVAAVSVMCQDRRVFDAMMSAGTPCPAEGQIGETARMYWEGNPDKIPKEDKPKQDDFYKKTAWGAIIGALLFWAF